jgi:hypothetical protein
VGLEVAFTRASSPDDSASWGRGSPRSIGTSATGWPTSSSSR